MSDRYGSRGTILTSGRTKHKSQTFDGSSNRTTSLGDSLSKRWENRIMRNPDSVEAQNIDKIRKHYAMKRLGITSQARMDRLKLALTNPYGSSSISWDDRPSYDDKVGAEWEKRHAKRVGKN